MVINVDMPLQKNPMHMCLLATGDCLCRSQLESSEGKVMDIDMITKQNMYSTM